VLHKKSSYWSERKRTQISSLSLAETVLSYIQGDTKKRELWKNPTKIEEIKTIY
jgi:hypothetical protein